VRNDALTVSEIRRLAPQAVVLSPGPCTPAEAGCSVDVVRELYRELPILGVCLGHQAIAAAFGARIVAAPEPMHGRTSEIVHGNSRLFANIPERFSACRYHSLVVEDNTLSPEFDVTARSDDGVIMAFEHTDLPLAGVQFHPEAVLTQHGYQLLANFLKMAGILSRQRIEDLTASEFQIAGPVDFQLPPRPVTF
jgi:anthranilate synthase/aminodeoxychorismate synthase-like glutamine amidotransferase